jgi:hypothetical protein
MCVARSRDMTRPYRDVGIDLWTRDTTGIHERRWKDIAKWTRCVDWIFRIKNTVPSGLQWLNLLTRWATVSFLIRTLLHWIICNSTRSVSHALCTTPLCSHESLVPGMCRCVRDNLVTGQVTLHLYTSQDTTHSVLTKSLFKLASPGNTYIGRLCC